MQPANTAPQQQNSTMHWYQAVWRWHFYTGLIVTPLLLMLSLSGLLMLLSKPLDNWLNRQLLVVTATGPQLTDSALLKRVQQAYPQLQVKFYIPPRSSTATAMFSLQSGAAQHHAGHSAASRNVYLNPYSGEVLGSLDPEQSLYHTLKTLHGSLFLGAAGDTLIEITAGFTVLMLISGLYLAWPKTGWRALLPSGRFTLRSDWLRWHKAIGWLIALPLLLFLLSGLAWTNAWGGKLVQPWGSLPGTRYTADTVTHAAMNQPGAHQVPWALEQTALPGAAAGQPLALNIDNLSQLAKQHGFSHYRIHLPGTERAVWTLSATTIANDITNPAAERIMHLDSSGRVLADIRFADYPMLGKAMAAFIPWHQGDLGWWNWLLNVLLVLLITFLIIAGSIMWLKRRLKHNLAAPIARPALSKKVLLVMLLLALCFPLSAAVLLLIVLVDTLHRLKRN